MNNTELKKRGRPEGGKNPKGHSAGRKKKQIPNQSRINSYWTLTTSANSTTDSEGCDVGIQTDPLSAEQLQYFISLNQQNSESTGEEVDLSNSSLDTNESSQITEDPESRDSLGNTMAIVNEEAEVFLAQDVIDDAEIRELNENEFADIDNEIGTVPAGSVIDNYLAEIQTKIKDGKITKDFLKSNFWINPKASFFSLSKVTKNPFLLCIPKVFLWFPHHLQTDLKCPYCKYAIESKGFNTDPRARRIVDLYDSFYIMTMRYVCKGNVKHNFNGYNEGLMKQLNLNLQAQFPAVLTHRSGLSKSLVQLMRPSFQHGIGPHRMAKMLRIMHTERYDELQLQYYVALDQLRQHPTITSFFGGNQTFAEFPKYNDKNAYNGFSPSANYISYVYGTVISKLRPYMDHMISMLDGIILKGDHSFKIINHMAKVNGVSTFSCLYTLLNEYEEIRLMVLSHSKKLENLAPQFLEMMKSYQKLGMSVPELFYTDNVVGDQSFLKEVIPSLCKDVVEIKRNTSKPSTLNGEDCFYLLPVAKLPENMVIKNISDPILMDEVCQQILDTSLGECVLLGFDCEWFHPTPISLIQICYKTTVYLFRVHLLNADSFPSKLSKIIESDDIIKIGKNIQSDFTRLNRHFNINTPKGKGRLELGTLCYSKGLTPRSNLRLDQICGHILKMYLPKTPMIRCGNWEVDVLSQEQEMYAALDAWVSLEIYNRIKDLPSVNQKVDDSAPEGTFVSIYSKTSNRLVPSGFGYITKNTEDIQMIDKELIMKKTMSVVNVIEVKVPCMIMECHTVRDMKPALGLFGEVPFKAVISNACLKTSSEQFYTLNKTIINESSSTSSALMNNEISTDSQQASVPNNHPSRILKDAFHIMQMIRVSLKHGMAKDFIRRFRDALFVVDPEDKRNVEEYLLSIGTDWKSRLLVDPEYIFKRVKRYIPPPVELFPQVELVFKKYGNSVCVNSGKPLFNEDAWKDAKAVLEEIRVGHVSDVVGGPPLYTEVGYDKNGLMVYRCSRGTSSVEGSVHMNIIRKFASYNAGPRLTDMVLADYRLYHNIDVGSKNRFGKIHKGHYSPWLSQAINTLRLKNNHPPIEEYFCNRLGNAFEFEQTEETFGIVSLPICIMRELNIEPATVTISTNTESNFLLKNLLQVSTLPLVNLPKTGYSAGDFMYKYLAQCQRTKIAVTAVHTDEEMQLYHLFLTDPIKKQLIKYTEVAKKPDFTEFAKLWSLESDSTKKIYYKTARHLESYFNILEDRKKYGDSVLLNIEMVKEVTSTTQSETRYKTPIITLPAPRRPNVDQLSLLTDLNFQQDTSSTTTFSTLIAPAPYRTRFSNNPRFDLGPYLSHSKAPKVTKKQKNKRTCLICKIDGCGGRSKRHLCTNKCGICERDSCKGRYKLFPCDNSYF